MSRSALDISHVSALPRAQDPSVARNPPLGHILCQSGVWLMTKKPPDETPSLVEACSKAIGERGGENSIFIPPIDSDS
jgi:hypothetical protein